MGKTNIEYMIAFYLEKHPHGRGEDGSRWGWQLGPWETPPRAWGRQASLRHRQASVGNTPTGVGKTSNGDPLTSAAETPPRAWGRQKLAWVSGSKAGNTPTGVGKTSPRCQSKRALQKHPHGRGEDITRGRVLHAKPETPPRAWGRLPRRTMAWPPLGNTPTGVGKT